MVTTSYGQASYSYSVLSEIGMESNPVYGMGTVDQEGQIPTQPNPVYGTGTVGQGDQCLTLGMEVGPMDTCNDDHKVYHLYYTIDMRRK